MQLCGFIFGRTVSHLIIVTGTNKDDNLQCNGKDIFYNLSVYTNWVLSRIYGIFYKQFMITIVCCHFFTLKSLL